MSFKEIKLSSCHQKLWFSCDIKLLRFIWTSKGRSGAWQNQLLRTSKVADQSTAFRGKRWVFTADWFKNRRCGPVKFGVWWTEELSKYPVIWGKPGLSFFLIFPLDLCIQVWTWKDEGLGKEFIWICKGIFWKAAFLKGSTVQLQVCRFKMQRNHEWKPF